MNVCEFHKLASSVKSCKVLRQLYTVHTPHSLVQLTQLHITGNMSACVRVLTGAAYDPICLDRHL